MKRNKIEILDVLQLACGGHKVPTVANLQVTRTIDQIPFPVATDYSDNIFSSTGL